MKTKKIVSVCLSFASVIFSSSALAQQPRGGNYNYPSVTQPPVHSQPDRTIQPHPVHHNHYRPTLRTTFSCTGDQHQPGVVWLSGYRQGPDHVPLIRFSPEGSRSFGVQYDPASRCQSVRGRLQAAIDNPGIASPLYSLKGVKMLPGHMNGRDIVCAVPHSYPFSYCQTSANGVQGGALLLTLKHGQYPAGQVANEFMNIAFGGYGSVIRETDGSTSIYLGDWEEKANTQQPAPSNPTNNTPVNNPIVPRQNPQPNTNHSGGNSL